MYRKNNVTEGEARRSGKKQGREGEKKEEVPLENCPIFPPLPPGPEKPQKMGKMGCWLDWKKRNEMGHERVKGGGKGERGLTGDGKEDIGDTGE